MLSSLKLVWQTLRSLVSSGGQERKDFALQQALQGCQAENVKMRAEGDKLRAALSSAQAERDALRSQLDWYQGPLPRETKRVLWLSALFLAVVPPVFLSRVPMDELLAPALFLMAGLVAALAYLINVSAPLRHDFVGRPADKWSLLRNRVRWQDWVLAALSGVAFIFGSWGVSDWKNLLGLSASYVLMVAPALMRPARR